MVDFGPTAQDYARHRAGFPPELFQRLEARGWVRPGADALDVGAGTGALSIALAKLGLHVTALDLSAPLLAEAERAAAEQHVRLETVEVPAEQTGQPRAAFDLVTAGQCWHWFDRAAVALEAKRVLRPGGRVLIAHLDWLAFGDNLVARTLAAIDDCGGRWPEHVLKLAHDGLYPRWTRDLREAGFAEIETFSFDVDVSYTKASWRGRIRASAAIGGSLPAEGVAAFDAELARRLAQDPEALEVPHRVFVASARVS